MKKWVGLFVCFSVLIVPCGAMGKQRASLKMGILPVIDTLPLIVACDKGLFEQEDIDVQLFSFNSALERDAALTSGQIDGYFADLVITLLLNEKGQNLKVLTESYHTTSQHPMFALLSSPWSDKRKPADIGESPVAISSGTIIEYFLDAVLDSVERDPSRVKRLEIKALPIRYQMLMAGSVELAMLPDPLVTKAVAGGAHLIADDGKLDTTATVLAVRAEVLEKYPGLAQKFLRAYARSVSMVNERPGDHMETLAGKTRFPRDLLGNYSMPHFPTPGPPSKEAVEAVETWLKGRKLITKTGTYEALVWKEPSVPE